MELIINGEKKIFDDNISLQNIIDLLKIEDKVMALSINMQIIKKENWSKITPKNNDNIELLQFVGGG
jgi:sulfur carrier protein